MLMLITYDVSTQDTAGRRRLRQVSRACQDFGQRVQLSVFECELNPAQWTALRAKLIEIIDPAADSLRFYHMGADARRRIEHVGARPATDLKGPLIV
ncbi:MAG: CRISPR-associated endonuclease Cas2 [Alphaproteobacteria bacterium]|nr:CRISPR-associated endonuclease Cas2 [Alphaproteobacteria bacterium]